MNAEFLDCQDSVDPETVRNAAKQESPRGKPLR